MIHTKSLIRRLAYVPWLLAFGLVVGWAGEAQAQSVKLSVDKTEVREDGGAVTIKVTAKTYNADGDHAALGVERVVQLNAMALFSMVTGPTNDDTEAPGGVQSGSGRRGDRVDGFGRRFTMTLPTIVIPKDQKEVSVESVFTPIPTNHENNDTVTTGDNPYKEERIPNSPLYITLSGSSGGAVDIAYEKPDGSDADRILITMTDADKPSDNIFLALDPVKISKEAEETAVEVTGRLDGALVNNQTLSFLLGVVDIDDDFTPDNVNKFNKGDAEAGRDADYDIELSTLTIARKKPNGSTTIQITPKNAGTGKIGIGSVGGVGGSFEELMITGTDVNQDGDTRDVYVATVPTPAGQTDSDPSIPGTAGPGFTITDVALNTDIAGDGFGRVSITVSEPEDHDPDGPTDNVDTLPSDAPEGATINDPNNNSYYAYSEAAVNIDNDLDLEGFDLNGDGDTEDYLKEVTEKDLPHFLAIRPFNFEIDAGAIAATKGLTATPNVIRESEVGQEEESREVSVKLDIELANALPDDARVRFFVRDMLTSLPDDFTADAQAATRGTDYTATVDDLVIPAGEKKGSTTLNLTVFDNGGKNAAKIIRVEARVGTVSKFTGIKIADDETATTTIALSASPGEVKAETGDQEVTVTGTLNGDIFDEDKKITLVIVSGDDYDKAATRDTEYTAVFRSLTIPAGETSGSTTVTVTALAGGDKKVWIGSVKNDPYAKNVNDDDILVSAIAVVLKDADEDEDKEDPGALKFAVDLSSTVYDGMVGSEIEVIELPEAEGGEGDRTYIISNNLPAGLSFDADDLTISGTPTATAVGETEVVYTVLDSEGSAATKLTIDIVAAAAPTTSVASVTATQTSIRENGRRL